MSLKSVLESALYALEDRCGTYVDEREEYGAITQLRKLLDELDSYQLVPKEPTAEMLQAACEDGICAEGRPVWKHDTEFQAKWKYQQMLENAPEIEL